MKGPESTSECWFTVWPPTGSWTDHWSHPKSGIKEWHQRSPHWSRFKNKNYFILQEVNYSLPLAPSQIQAQGGECLDKEVTLSTRCSKGKCLVPLPHREVRARPISCFLVAQNTYMPQGQIPVKLQWEQGLAWSCLS